MRHPGLPYYRTLVRAKGHRAGQGRGIREGAHRLAIRPSADAEVEYGIRHEAVVCRVQRLGGNRTHAIHLK